VASAGRGTLILFSLPVVAEEFLRQERVDFKTRRPIRYHTGRTALA
jgi:hypothetical protein